MKWKAGNGMAASLLAHLYSHIKGSQEDVATLSLQYIVSRFTALNQAFTGLLCRALHREPDMALNYVCQSVGKNMERPDMAGIDANGREQILCEAKFYAGLTENQPNGYLDRLGHEGACGLVFICPAARKVTLWGRLLELCRGRLIEYIDEYCVTVDGVHMAILTWGTIIDSLRHVAASEAADALFDIHQLDGFCKLMDSEAFIPFSTEDFGPEIAIREERYYQVVDTVFNVLMADKALQPSAKGLKATAYRNGYVRYIRIMEYSLSINYDRRLWRAAGSEETPFWVETMDRDFKQPEQYRRAFNRYPASWQEELYDGIALALFAPVNVPLDEIAEAIVRQIMEYISCIQEAIKCATPDDE